MKYTLLIKSKNENQTQKILQWFNDRFPNATQKEKEKFIRSLKN